MLMWVQSNITTLEIKTEKNIKKCINHKPITCRYNQYNFVVKNYIFYYENEKYCVVLHSCKYFEQLKLFSGKKKKKQNLKERQRDSMKMTPSQIPSSRISQQVPVPLVILEDQEGSFFLIKSQSFLNPGPWGESSWPLKSCFSDSCSPFGSLGQDSHQFQSHMACLSGASCRSWGVSRGVGVFFPGRNSKLLRAS